MLDFIKSRRSTRKFKPQIVPEDLIDQIIEAGRYAPSGSNSQYTHFIVVENQEVLDVLSTKVKTEFSKMELQENMYVSIKNSILSSKKNDYIFHYNCPVLIILANKADYCNNIADCACAMENMMLMANFLNLGSVWINQLKWLNENPVILSLLQEMGLAEDERVYCALALGYPDTRDGLPNRIPLKRKGNPVTYVK